MIFLFLFTATAAGQDRLLTLEAVPPLERSTPHFYNAVAAPGQAVKVEWTAASSVPLNGELTLTLTVRNAANPHELRRPDLTQFETITRHFQVIARDSPLAKPGDAAVQFTYALRPRESGQYELPRLEYRYFRPDLPSGRQFRTTYTQPLKFAIEPPSRAIPLAPLDGPEEFFALAEPTQLPSPGRFGWLWSVAAIPFVVAGWVLAWRWLFPDSARMARIRRHRAVRIALDRLHRAPSATDPAGEAAVAFRDYLATRFGMPPSAQTPTEVAAALRALNRTDEQAAEAEHLLQRADGSRFSCHSVNGQSLILEAEALIREWEEGE